MPVGRKSKVSVTNHTDSGVPQVRPHAGWRPPVLDTGLPPCSLRLRETFPVILY